MKGKHMNELDAIRERHSVRSYLEKPIEAEKINQLQTLADTCSKEAGLHIQLVCNEPEAFGRGIAKYGAFRNVRNYIVLAGIDREGAEEACGYYGEKIVLQAQMLGLNTCWVGLALYHRQAKRLLRNGEKLFAVIALGYGSGSGRPHKSKTLSAVSEVSADLPDWYIRGMEAVLLAPTAMNQQKFFFRCSGNTVEASADKGFFTKMDLGIVKYHFEIGAGKENFVWK